MIESVSEECRCYVYRMEYPVSLKWNMQYLLTSMMASELDEF